MVSRNPAGSASRSRRPGRSASRHGLPEPHGAQDMLSGDHGGGFSLDGRVRIEATDPAGLEQLIRYCARPSFALDQLHLVGNVTIRSSTPSQGPTPPAAPPSASPPPGSRIVWPKPSLRPASTATATTASSPRCSPEAPGHGSGPGGQCPRLTDTDPIPEDHFDRTWSACLLRPFGPAGGAPGNPQASAAAPKIHPTCLPCPSSPPTTDFPSGSQGP